MKSNIFKKLLTGILSATLVLNMALPSSFAGVSNKSGIMSVAALDENLVCPHHAHDDLCGYQDGQDCSHEHTDSCGTWVVSCTHVHTDSCEAADEDSLDTASDSDAQKPDYDSCDHSCSQETGCITPGCSHDHDKTCGYTEGSACAFRPYDCPECTDGQADLNLKFKNSLMFRSGPVLTVGGVSADYTATLNGLQQAFDDAVTGDTIRLEANVTFSDTINFNTGNTVTLDLNGHSLTRVTSAVLLDVSSDSQLTIADRSGGGVIQSEGNALKIKDGGSVTLEGGTVLCRNPGRSSFPDSIYVQDGTFIMNGGTVIGEVMNGKAIHAADPSSKVEINGGTISARSQYSNHGIHIENGGELLITGGMITAISSKCYAVSSDGDVVIEGGTLLAPDNAVVANKVEIKGGNIQGISVPPGNSIFSAVGPSDLQMYKLTGLPKNTHINGYITEPMWFNGITDVYADASGTLYFWFPIDFTGSVTVIYGTQQKTFEIGGVAASIGNQDYPSISTAVAAAQSGDVIVVKQNHTLSSSVFLTGKEIILDLNGFTVDFPGSVVREPYSLFNFGGFELGDDAKMTLRDSQGGGKLTASQNHAIYMKGSDSQFILESGTVYVSENKGIVLDNSTAYCEQRGGRAECYSDSPVYLIKGSFKMLDGRLHSVTPRPTIETSWTPGNDTSISIEGGLITSDGSTVISTSTFTTLDFSGGTIIGARGIGGGAISSGGNTTISGGTITHPSNAAVTCDGGTLTISGGTLIGNGRALLISENPYVYITGGSIRGSGAERADYMIADTDGNPLKMMTVSQLPPDKPVEALNLTPVSPYGIDGIKTDENGCIYLWLPKDFSGSAAVTIDGTVYNYTFPTGIAQNLQTDEVFDSLQEAFDHVYGRDTVKLLQNTTERSALEFKNKEVTLDLNGCSVSLYDSLYAGRPGDGLTYDPYASLTIIDSSPAGNGDLTGYGGNSATIVYSGTNTLTLESGTVAHANGQFAITSPTDTSTTVGSGFPGNSIVIKGGKLLTKKDGIAIYLMDTSNVTISGGLIDSGKNAIVFAGGQRGQYISNYSSLTMTGGEIKTATGDAIMLDNSVKANLSGGTVSSRDGYALSINGGEATLSGAALYSEKLGTIHTGKVVTLTIDGGIVSSPTESAIVNLGTLKLIIDGGNVGAVDSSSFKSDITIKNSDGQDLTPYLFSGLAKSKAITSLTMAPSYNYGLTSVVTDKNGCFSLWLPQTQANAQVSLVADGKTYTGTVANNTANLKTSGGSGSSGGSGGSGGSLGSNLWTSLPPGYTGATKRIGNVVVPAYVVEGTWAQEGTGIWKFTDKEGLAYKNIWAPVYNPHASQLAGQYAFDWFYFDENGKMTTGWLTDKDGTTYYLNPVSDNTLGAMKTKWVLIDGIYYYFSDLPDGTRGKLLKNTKTPDGYDVGEDGALK